MKKINYLIMFIIFVLCVTMKVYAAELPAKLTITKNTNGGLAIVNGERDYLSYFKTGKDINGTSYIMLCTKATDTAPETGNECIKSNDWMDTPAVSYGVASIISTAKNDISTTGMSPAYFATSLAINKFLYEKTNGTYGESINESVLGNVYTLPTGFTSTQFVEQYEKYLSAGRVAYSNYNEDITINLSSNSLTFEKSGSKYVSNTITVSGVNNYNVTTNIGRKVDETSNSFKIEINEEDVSSDTQVQVVVKSTKELPQARNYTCVSGTRQSLTPTTVETKTITKEARISGTITPKGTIEIKKVDEDGNFIKGSKIKIRCTDNRTCGDYEEIIETKAEPYIIRDLDLGIYLIQEIEAPEGYVLDTDGKTVRLQADNLYHKTEIVNKMTKLQISKLDAKTGKFLEGAKLQLEDKNGNIVKYCVDAKGNKNSECVWISGKEKKIIKGLPYGTYYLVEVSAPEGYELFSDKMEILLNKKDSSIEIELENYLEVKVPDTLSSKSTLLIAISMFDIALGIGIITYVKKNKVEE